MTDVEGSPAPRRSQRDKKQVKPYASGSQSPNKRKRNAEEDDQVDAQEMGDTEVEADDEDDADGVDDDGDDEPDTRPAKRKGKATKTPKPTKRKAKANGDFDADKLATETKISADNPLFNAIMNPSAALQSTAEDFLDSLAQSPGAAQAELINCILRACGCNDSVDADEVLDYDGVVDSLDNFTEGLKQENSPIYPPDIQLISRLVLSAADVGALYTSDMVTTLQTWVVAMSSSQIRAFRHTATAVALEVETALCQVAAAVEKEAEIERRAALAEYLKEIVDGVFVHRYRDLDPHIRAECVRAMDSATPVRLEAVRALSAVYGQAEYIGGLMNFTARFKPRLLEMAARDTELAVRTAVLGVLGVVDQHGLLEDEEREQMCQLVFDSEVRVRKAVAGFVGGLWNELVEERLAGRKALAMLLVRWDRERVEEEDGSQDGSQRGVTMSADIKGRTALAVEALWDDVDSASGWEGLLEMLLLDHSAGGGEEDLDAADDSIAASAKNTVDEAWRLTETEESVLLEVFIASLRRARALAGTTKKGEDETLISDLTRALIKGSTETDANRIANVLLIPPLMNVELNTNSTKILELEDELAAQLRDAVGGREEIEVAGFNEDEVCALIGTRDMCGWMEESEGGKQSCVWDIVAALVERGRLGYREEERMIEQGLQVLGLHIMWKTRSLPDAKEATPEDEKYMENLREQRDSLLEKLVEYAVGTQSNTAEAVKRTAFQNLMTLHILFCAEQTTTPDGRVLPTAALPLDLDDEYTAIEQYAELLEEGQAPGEEEASESGESSGEENVPVKGMKGKTKAKSPVIKEQPLTRTRLEQEYVFMGTISTFLRAIRAGAVHVRHSAVLLAHYGRLGPAFDLCTKVIIDSLREEGMYRENGDAVVDVVTQALKESFTLILDSVVRGEDHVVALAKQLGQSFVIRGAQLSIVKKLDSQYIVQTHTNLLTWIVKRIGTYEAAKNKKARKTAILFFRVLQPLLTAVDSRDALKIMRAYEKKLSSIMAKDKGGAKGRKAKGAKSAAMVTSDESESEPEPQPAEEEPPAPTLRPKPRPLRRQRSPTSSLSELETSDPEAGVQEHIEEANEKPEAEPEVQAEHEQEQPHRGTTPSVPSVSNGITPPSTRKRQRTDEDDEDAGEKSGVEAIEANGDAATPGDEAPREESPLTEIIFRRKRARH
ncbi:hypothetical protein DFJ58DRAFT_797077 [Suillus subalutaceus]|uniref:uncharacterized protein n=1 Tax=Suillus subalutaceus TaxID=48586 RepID=UPI001B85B9D8|nr:uncharacterized protein DFJ58DRAFT_797077 [Suillus subalutaceus]KAG1847841.1 hypothetical protein DFJ58DRAFT_797077 [Suillus subalutaceus]